MAIPRPPKTTLMSAAGALEMFAISTGQFQYDKSTLTKAYDVPFPASLYTGLGDERLDVLDDLVASLGELRATWAVDAE